MVSTFNSLLAHRSPSLFVDIWHLIHIRLIHVHKTEISKFRITDLGLKPTGRARQQGDPNVPNQPSQGGQDVDYFPKDLMQYSMRFMTTTWNKCQDMQRGYDMCFKPIQPWELAQFYVSLVWTHASETSHVGLMCISLKIYWVYCLIPVVSHIFPVQQPQLRPTEAF